MTRAIVLALAGCLAMNAAGASAAETAAPAPAAPAAQQATVPADAAICPDDAAKSAEQQKRDAALAELGRRLAAEPKEEGEFRVLNRSGHNYGRPMPEVAAPPAKPAPPAKSPPAPDAKAK